MASRRRTRALLHVTFLVLLPVIQNGVLAFTSTDSRRAPSCRSSELESDVANDNAEKWHPPSHVLSIKSTNIAGIIGDGLKDDTGIRVDFGHEPCLVAITGESGSGKSLLVSKAIDLVTGGKAVSTLIPSRKYGSEINSDNPSSIEISVCLNEPHISAISTSIKQFGINPDIFEYDDDGACNLHLKRTFSVQESGRMKSICRINGKHISLKTLKQISAPLFARVDVGVASAALGRATSRIKMIDIGVPEELKQNCIQMRDVYRKARNHREKIKRDLESRVLPPSLQRGGDGEGLDEEQMKLLEHWVEELDLFEKKITQFIQSVAASCNEMVPSERGSSSCRRIAKQIQISSWGDMTGRSEDCPLFTSLLDFREEMKTAEAQLVSTSLAYETLASLSVPNSASVAIENARKLLYDISVDDSGPLFESIERTHELLNQMEGSLNECARSIDGNPDSILSTLEKMAFTEVSMEEIDCIIADWNAMARKHGISPYSLPNCHVTLREELDGNVEALELMPKAEEDERIAREDYSIACSELSKARREVACRLSESVTGLLPSLGLEGTTFQVQLNMRPGGIENPYYGSESIGVDLADFILLHAKGNNGDQSHGGNIEQIGSSGEKSRVLLAIETVLPGSIGSTCNNNADTSAGDEGCRPISIIYDEIDAHVGGRAAVTMAKLLADQTQGGNQIIAITHSASLAAIADRHIVVERGSGSGPSQSMKVRACVVDGSSRTREIARMASGDLATGEAETFADALIRDALLSKEA